MVRKYDEFSALSALGLLGAVGLTVAMGVLAGVFGGLALDRALDGHGLILSVMIFLGLAMGIVAAYFLIAKELPWKR